ncbi:DUF3231 family protein [Ammoniphilus sp. CFH 90114]|uniref:DUF3231 family protein n=1 Tax=Ammoniphilus sp. CFH 90114 TaxID=2493665 RepID=UPI00100F3E1B|nr:DUF3231 family protein [Ammoniphilus sp. CFH 90114]RXT03617.1 DUF3231 family protein [Ammoniphilus sp. CFH 90114]
MESERQVMMSTSELAHLWTTYMNDSMAICVLKQFLGHVKDKEIEGLLHFALSLSQEHLHHISSLFNNEDIAIPEGFSEQNDVDLSAPRLFSDTFYLFYLHNMGKIGGNGYSLSLANSARTDISKFFEGCVQASAELYNRTRETLLSKGLFLRPPQIVLPKRVEFVEKQGFLNGWLGDRRPLNCIEVMNIFFNIERNEIGRSLIMGFSQVAQTKEVIDFFVRGKQIASKQIEVFGSLLSESNLSASMTWDTIPTESTTPTFSEKLMMFHVAALTGASLSHYGTSLGSSPRRDIGMHYTRFMQEIALFAEDGANILIKNGWMEQPPMATDREALTKK